jgi:hypothetical protein
MTASVVWQNKQTATTTPVAIDDGFTVTRRGARRVTVQNLGANTGSPPLYADNVFLYVSGAGAQEGMVLPVLGSYTFENIDPSAILISKHDSETGAVVAGVTIEGDWAATT